MNTLKSYKIFLLLFCGITLIASAVSLSPEIQVEKKDAHPGKNDGSMHITITGGKAPYNIVILSSVVPVRTYKNQHDIQINDLPAGEYSINVQDAGNAGTTKHVELLSKE